MNAAIATTVETDLPTGRWDIDAVHSSASFAVRHMLVATFRGRFEELDATLVVDGEGSAQLTGTVRADSIAVKDEGLAAHLKAPDFFDVERYPEIRFASRSIRRDGDQLVIDGELTINDHTRRLESRGQITGPAETLGGATKVGIALETIVDRTQFGLNWNAPLPRGGVALANDVTLTVELELVLSEGDEA